MDSKAGHPLTAPALLMRRSATYDAVDTACAMLATKTWVHCTGSVGGGASGGPTRLQNHGDFAHQLAAAARQHRSASVPRKVGQHDAWAHQIPQPAPKKASWVSWWWRDAGHTMNICRFGPSIPVYHRSQGAQRRSFLMVSASAQDAQQRANTDKDIPQQSTAASQVTLPYADGFSYEPRLDLIPLRHTKVPPPPPGPPPPREYTLDRSMAAYPPHRLVTAPPIARLRMRSCAQLPRPRSATASNRSCMPTRRLHSADCAFDPAWAGLPQRLR